MAQRRSFQNANDEFRDPYGEDADMIGGGFNAGGAPLEGAPGQNPQDPFGNGRDRPDAFFNLSPEDQQAIIDMQAGAIGGNNESAREVGGGWMPNTPVTRQGQQPQPDMGLPQGVSVEERAGPEDAFSQDTPPMSMAPDPVSAHMPDPMQTAPMQTAAAGPTRRSFSNAAPALFDEAGGGGRMFGGAGGLMGGGRGAVGTNAGGPTPTEMMLSILRQLRAGG